MSAMVKNFMRDVTLDVKADKSFTMTAMGQPAAGTWTIETRAITLTPEFNPSNQIKLTLSDDGKKLSGDQGGTTIELVKTEAK